MYCNRVGGHYRHRVFAEIVVVDDGAEGKQYDGGSERVLGPFTKVRNQRLLRQCNAVNAFGARDINLAKQDDKGSAAADDEGVDEH